MLVRMIDSLKFYVGVPLQVISRDTAMLGMLHSFLQDAPQLIFQMFLLYRSPGIIAPDIYDPTSSYLNDIYTVYCLNVA